MRVLIVDDRATRCDGLERHYRPLGFEVLKAYSCQEAWEALNKNPDVRVISWDFSLHHEDSEEAIRALDEAGFPGLMIAHSNNPDHRKIQLVAGCTLQMNKWRDEDFFSSEEFRAALDAVTPATP